MTIGNQTSFVSILMTKFYPLSSYLRFLCSSHRFKHCWCFVSLHGVFSTFWSSL